MSEQLDNNYPDKDSVAPEANTDLIYSYTEALIKAQNESLNRLDTKLGGFLAFTGVLVKFAADLPGGNALREATGFTCYSCIVLKVLTFGFLVIAALFLCLGLTAKLRGKVVSPKVLMKDEWYFADKENCQCFIINTWVEAEKEYVQVGFEKGRRLNGAVWLISAALTTLTISTLLATIF
jgi:hypothetical protein